MIHHDDKVWFDESNKLEQICYEVSRLSAGRKNVLLLSHFEATVSRLASLLRDRQQKYERFSSADPAELCDIGSGRVWLGLAGAFQVATVASKIVPGELVIIVVEHHPLRSRDETIISASERVPCNTELCFHFSLDDPVMQHFGGETVKALFERLGVAKDESVSHRLVTVAIQNAQEKIEKRVGKDLPAHSAEDWFNYNLRP